VPAVPIAVLVSGRGSNLQALLDATREGAPGRIALVISDKQDAGALDVARKAGVAAEWVAVDGREADATLALFARHRIGLVVLAGYLKKVSDRVVAAFKGRIVNVHPALLPAFGGPGMYGRRVHEAVLKSGARLSGVTVHLVDEQYDHGPVLAQWPVPVREGDTTESLAARVLKIEHRLLPAVVLACCERLQSGANPAALSAAAESFALSTSIPDLRHAFAPA